jgi:hypothetical protein
MEYVLSHDKVWLPQRIEIARHWHAHHKPSDVSAPSTVAAR